MSFETNRYALTDTWCGMCSFGGTRHVREVCEEYHRSEESLDEEDFEDDEARLERAESEAN